MDDVHPKMRFSLTTPASKAILSSTINLGTKWNRESGVGKNEYQQNGNNNNNNNNNNNDNIHCNINCDKDTMQREDDRNNSNKTGTGQTTADAESTSDYKQWLHAMKLVARLPGGIPPEFRRKLWLSLADKYLKAKNVDWAKEEEKCFCEKWREDDEELGIQIVKDLHRTGSTLCTGPAGDINQAKLKRILLGYARYNPEVGYCQGFNMLGALILQVMDKEETESMKVMVYLVEGILPPGYFCGSMGGLQADMAVFRELMQTKLPRLARHLQKLQGPIENAFEPPLTNVFTMQWFLTMFCTCLPMSCVLRVWDLVLIEGSDVLLRTALALWSLLEDRVLSTRSADDFYGKMGSFSSELLNGHLIDSNGLIEKVVQLGPIEGIEKLREKHLNSMTPLKNKSGLNFYYDDDEADMDEDSRLAVATVWGIPWGRRGSQGQTANAIAKQATESKDRIALDISLLKKQYDRLRERQKQAHIILTTACSTARQSAGSSTYSTPLPVNQLLSGRPAIVTNRGRRSGPPTGAIPPARKPSLPAVLQDKPLEKKLKRGETIQWRDTNDTKRRRDSLTWKEIRAERASLSASGSIEAIKSQKIRTKRLGKSDSSSYSEESDDEINDKAGGSSSDTSLCDDDHPVQGSGRKTTHLVAKQRTLTSNSKETAERQRPKSWAPSNSDIPFVLMTTDSPNNSADEFTGREAPIQQPTTAYMQLTKEEDEEDEEEEDENSATESDQNLFAKDNLDKVWSNNRYSPLKEEKKKIESNSNPLLGYVDVEALPPTSIYNAAQEKPLELQRSTTITSPPAVKPFIMESTNSLGSEDGEECESETKEFGVSDEGVTNQYFERVNSTERPTKLDLLYSLNEENSIGDAYKESAKVEVEDENIMKNNKNRCMDILVDYSEKSSAACIAEAKTEISSSLQKSEYSNKSDGNYTSSAASKRRNPRRLTLTRSSTMEIEKRYQALEKRLSMEVSSKYRMPSVDKNNDMENTSSTYEYKRIVDKGIKSMDNFSPPQLKSPAESQELREEEKETASEIISIMQRKSKIPSTADLELRFASIVLDKVSKVSKVSDSEGSTSSGKAPTSPKETTGRSSTNKSSPNEPSRGNIKSKEESIKSDSHPNNDHLEDESESHNTGNIEEDQHSSTEKKSQVESPASKNTARPDSLQRKKEPPDNKSPKDSDKAIHRKASPRDKEETPGKDHKTAEKREKPLKDENKSREQDQTSSSRRQSTVNKKSHNEGDKEDVSPTKSASKKSLQKKSPPSTEELEKRFNALEKQMSTSKTEGDEDEDEQVFASHHESDNEEASKDKQHETDSEVIKSSTSRRASEPPSTEDLEKRYEVLKRRMSSKHFETNRNKRYPSDSHERDSTKTEDNPNEKKTSKDSPPSTDSLEKRFDKLQTEADNKASKNKKVESKVKDKDKLGSIAQMAVKSQKSETPTANKESFSDIMQKAVKAQKAEESSTPTKESFSDIMQKAVKAQKAEETATPTKESFSDIMHKAVKVHKEEEASTPSKESFSDIMQKAVKAQKAEEASTPSKESFSDIMQKAVKAQRAEEASTPSKESFSDIMQKAVKAQRAEEASTPSKESFSDIMQKAVKAQRAEESSTPTKESLSTMQKAVKSQKAEESATPTKESFSDIMHKAVKAQRGEEASTPSKESFSDIMQKAVKAQRHEEASTPSKESFSDIMQKAVKAQKAEEASTPSKESFSDIMQKAVKAQKAEDASTPSKESFSDIMQKAVKAQKADEASTPSKESFSDIMQKAVKAQKADEASTPSKESFSDIMQKAVKAQKAEEASTPSKESFSDIMQKAVKAQKAEEASTPSKESFSDIMQKAVKAQRAEDSATPTKESFSDIMQKAVKVQKAAETPTTSKDSLSGIVQMAVDARKTAESSETSTKNKETFSDIMHMAVKAQKKLETPTKSKDSLSDIVQMAREAQKITTNEEDVTVGSRQGSRSALIEELQTKMDAAASGDGENIKPSSINPNRKTPQNTHVLRKSNTDETSETHATTAYSKSEKYEHIHSPNRKMVRRFSDLPSRADLENRLLFLEEQLSKTLLQQRRASDSEVASHSRDHIRPPGTLRYAGKLEARVRELEKQLSGTGKTPKKLDNLHIDASKSIPLEITTDSINATGKELVRYTHYGEIDEQDTHNPINISINIHMTLNKDDLEKSSSQNTSKAEEINKRLLILEQQLKTSHINIASSSSIPRDLCESAKDASSDALAKTPNATPVEVPSEVKDKREIVLEPANIEEVVTDQHLVETVNDNTDVTGDTEVNDQSNGNDEHDVEEVKVISETEKHPTPEVSAVATELVVEELTPSPKNQAPDKDPSPKTEESTATKQKLSMEEESAAKDLRRAEAIAKAEDLDRRLQILEEHIRKSQSSNVEQHKESLKTESKSPKTEEANIHQSSKSVKQSEPEKPEQKENAKVEEMKSKKTTAEETVKETKDQSSAAEEATKAVHTNEEAQTTLVEDKVPEVKSCEKSHEPIDVSQMVPVEVNKKTLVLMLDNEPKAVKVRRLTRANTEELEGLFEALEKQLVERSQIKQDGNTTKALEAAVAALKSKEMEQKSSQEISDLSREIEEFSKSCKTDKTPTSTKKPKDYDDYDWGRDPVKHHLKKKTVYLPSTKELESRFRSLERQIKILEDVEKIDVEQRLVEIDRKLKLQYSLSHEKDLVRFLDLCEGKGLDETPPPVEQQPVEEYPPERIEYQDHYCEHNRYGIAAKRHQSPSRYEESPDFLPQSSVLSAADLRKSRLKSAEKKREPIHPLEMLLDPSPDERDIPTTGELEHRMRLMEENQRTPSPASRKSHSKSPVKMQTYTEIPETPSPSGLPTADQLEARLAALEKEHRFDFKMQKNYKEFNQKLKDIISPSLSFEEFKAARSSSSESATRNIHRTPSPKSTGCVAAGDSSGPKVIRFHEDQHQRPKSRNDSEIMVSISNDVIQILEENSYIIQRILKKPIADSHGSHSSINEGLGVMGIRLMRETSPLRRKGTHTGVPLRTGENINDQLTSIKNTIKSIDSLCEEKPYRKERCQQYIDSLFNESTHFASKKSSLDDLSSRHLSRSASREYGPSIRISEHSPAFTRSIGSAESLRSSSPLRPTTPLQYHSNRDLRREISPRRRRDEEREENESRVRRDNLLPNIHSTYNNHNSSLSHSLTKFHKVDSQLISNDVDVIDVALLETYRNRQQQQAMVLSANESSSIRDSNNTNTSNNANTTTMTPPHSNNDITFKGSILDRPISPYRQLGLSRSNTPVYAPAKLEIRHTTVTSTFYDRVLAEKQLEKKHSTASANRSPLLELPIRSFFQTDKSPSNSTMPSPDNRAAITFSGTDSDAGNYRSYQSVIVAKTPSPVAANKETLDESHNHSMSPKT